MDTLSRVDRRAREQHVSATRRTRTPRTRSQSLGAQRDALAGQIRLALWNAEFNDQKIDEKQAKDWIEQADGLPRPGGARSAASSTRRRRTPKELEKINHIVVIYEENHSFDNLYGGWEGVNGLAQRRRRAHARRSTRPATPTPASSRTTSTSERAARRPAPTPRPGRRAARSRATSRTRRSRSTTTSRRPTRRARRTRCSRSASPNGWLNGHRARPGGCTRDLVHRFYHEQYQLDGGKQDRYIDRQRRDGPDAWASTTRRPCRSTSTCTTRAIPNYAIEDNFFQAAFGGSFLNHQWLIAAASPVDPTGAPGGANARRHPVLDANGMPSNEPLYTSDEPGAAVDPARPRADRDLRPGRDAAGADQGLACGNYGVNTMQPVFYPSGTFGALLPAADGADDRRPADRRRRRLGVVRGRLVERQRRHRATRAIRTGRPRRRRPTGCSDPNVDPNSRTGVPAAHWPRCPDNAVPVPPPAVQLLRELLDRDAGGPGQPGRAPAGRGRLPAARGLVRRRTAT